LASVTGGSSSVVCRSGHKQCGPWNLCRVRYSSHISGVTRFLSSTGLASSLSFYDSQYQKTYQKNGFNSKSKGSNDKINREFSISLRRTFRYDGMAVGNGLLGIWNRDWRRVLYFHLPFITTGSSHSNSDLSFNDSSYCAAP
jgi:hypothetical protein